MVSGTRIILIEGAFEDSIIEPSDVWRTLGHDLLLVNSVDEGESGAGGISKRIRTGCELYRQTNAQLNLGDFALRECHGPYRNSLNIRWVANLAIIINDNPDSEKPPCWNEYRPVRPNPAALAAGL